MSPRWHLIGTFLLFLPIVGCAHLSCPIDAAPLLEAEHSSNGGSVAIKVYPDGCLRRDVLLFTGAGRHFTRTRVLHPPQVQAIRAAIDETAFFDLPDSISSKLVVVNGEYRRLAVRGVRREHVVTLFFPESSSAPPEAARFLTVWATVFDIAAEYP